MSYSTTDLSIWFDIKTEVEDDFLIRCRHYRSETERVSAFRIFANTGFVLDDVLRLKYVISIVFIESKQKYCSR